MMNANNLSLLVIAGGKSTRLGKDKRQLQLGYMPLLEIILAKGKKAGFTEIFLCAEAPSPFLAELAKKYGATLLFDEDHLHRKTPATPQKARHQNRSNQKRQSRLQPGYERQGQLPLQRSGS